MNTALQGRAQKQIRRNLQIDNTDHFQTCDKGERCDHSILVMLGVHYSSPEIEHRLSLGSPNTATNIIAMRHWIL